MMVTTIVLITSIPLVILFLNTKQNTAKQLKTVKVKVTKR
ncbi:hypothetical protein Celal_2659 [Cellulophaga algicola DSM 14237]|uniref:Uncharacterized protein n=1 Tax=Cellulophaga algicola (strain DSM 14237 / IC166 / ACAM 630) TaxID=688270 RepID=E6XB80_CELAD|nr:hypothetical protein Celal_2659 [Cellulophaga algicola DSM 14237]